MPDVGPRGCFTCGNDRGYPMTCQVCRRQFCPKDHQQHKDSEQDIAEYERRLERATTADKDL